VLKVGITSKCQLKNCLPAKLCLHDQYNWYSFYLNFIFGDFSDPNFQIYIVANLCDPELCFTHYVVYDYRIDTFSILTGFIIAQPLDEMISFFDML
jgi:hypothetical protein